MPKNLPEHCSKLTQHPLLYMYKMQGGDRSTVEPHVRSGYISNFAGLHPRVYYLVGLPPLHKRDWEPVTVTLQALSLVEKAEPVQVRSTLCSRDQRSMWMPDGCKVHMDSYMASNGSCFLVTWTIFKNHLLEVGLTQNWETMALRTLTAVDLFWFYHEWGPAWIEIHWNSSWLRARSHINSHYTRGSVTTLHDFGMCLGDGLLDTHKILWSRLSARVWSGPNNLGDGGRLVHVRHQSSICSSREHLTPCRGFMMSGS